MTTRQPCAKERTLQPTSRPRMAGSTRSAWAPCADNDARCWRCSPSRCSPAASACWPMAPTCSDAANCRRSTPGSRSAASSRSRPTWCSWGSTTARFQELRNHQLPSQFPFPRRYYAKAIDHLRSAGAKTIVMDIEFAHPSKRTRRRCPVRSRGKGTRENRACGDRSRKRRTDGSARRTRTPARSRRTGRRGAARGLRRRDTSIPLRLQRASQLWP